jgi:2-keto-3-deoxy-L-rhamnonate aldolase RhmA
MKVVVMVGYDGPILTETMMAADLKSTIQNNLKRKLAAGQVASCMSVRIMRGIEIARIAQTCGYDSLYVDMEHNSFSIDTASQIFIAALDAGIYPMVRVPAHGSEYIARCMDGGAMGIIAPHVNNANEAKAVVEVAKYAPLGRRSVATGLPCLQYRNWPGEDVLAITNEATTVVAQIETRAGMENVDEIAAVDGVDILLIGTNDLLAELGLSGQYEHPVVRDVYARTIAAAKKHGKYAGIGGLAAQKDLITEFVNQGATFVSRGTDLTFLMSAATEGANFVAAFNKGR